MDHDPVTGEYVGPVGPLVLSGEIVTGDYDALISKILADENRFLAQNKIILASDGGDVAEALKIAKLVKSLHSRLIVGTLTGSVSAHAFLFMLPPRSVRPTATGCSASIGRSSQTLRPRARRRPHPQRNPL